MIENIMSVIVFILALAGSIVAARYCKNKLSLYRDRRNKKVSGVCAGIAKRFDVPPLVPRAVFVIGTLAIGLILVLYITLWVIIPEEPSWH